MEEEFRKYVEQFDLNEKSILLKYYHCLRVKDLCALIAKSENLSSEDVALSKIIGLLHDYGRFYQWSEYHTFNDLKSVDHGDFAVERLFINNEILKFWPNVKDFDEIFDAIKYHNKLNVPEVLSDHNAKLCRILRDADKLDILYIWSNVIHDINETDKDITDKVKDDFDKETLVNYENVKTDDDHLIQILSLVYDLNFKYSFKHLKDYDLVNKLYERLKNKQKYKYYFDKINDYIERMI